MTPAGAGGPLAPTPSLRRRLAAFVYEGVLLFGVLMIAALAYGLVTQQRHALVGMHGLQGFLFAVLGSYFGWFWSHGGQTVAMKTWHIRLQSKDGGPVPMARALLRYLCSWLWFLPALLWSFLAGVQSGGAVALALTIGVLAYALSSRLNSQRQYWHDLLSGTRLVQCRPPPQRRR
ncbi:MAG TPA: RDD family protein [Rubrivivax sp.]|nr:RDD family protein [Rubrivivax sp.]